MVPVTRLCLLLFLLLLLFVEDDVHPEGMVNGPCHTTLLIIIFIIIIICGGRRASGGDGERSLSHSQPSRVSLPQVCGHPGRQTSRSGG